MVDDPGGNPWIFLFSIGKPGQYIRQIVTKEIPAKENQQDVQFTHLLSIFFEHSHFDI
jgi:hypothetical protein